MGESRKVVASRTSEIVLDGELVGRNAFMWRCKKGITHIPPTAHKVHFCEFDKSILAHLSAERYVMKIITLLNHKGGVGKTTMAVTIASGLAAKGKRVMLVDADGQGSATIALGFKKSPAFYDLIVRGAMYEQVLQVVPPERYMKAGRALATSDKPMRINGEAVGDAPSPTSGFLWVVGGNAETLNIDPMANTTTVRQRLHDLEEDVDVIVIDTSPTPSKLHAGIYLATDYILYVTEVEYLAYDGLLESIRYFKAAQNYRLDYGIAQMAVMALSPTNNAHKPHNIKPI